MGKPIDITGQKFGKLTVLGLHHLGKRNARYWLCKCECGKETVQISADLKSGRTKSCGCQRYIELSERNRRHGMAGTRIYRIWRGMLSRCKYKTATGYENYGARGISRNCVRAPSHFIALISGSKTLIAFALSTSCWVKRGLRMMQSGWLMAK